METEKASHETEESLILAQLNAAQHADSLIATTKLQNGAPCPEGAGPQVNGDANWNHYKAGAGVNPMKRLRERSGSPAPMPGLYDQGSCMMNGELKQALEDQSLLSLHQPKRIRGDSDRNGDEDMAPSLVEGFPELSKQSDFECNALRKETKLDKRNCNFPNGDIFTLSRNKQMPISNGATMSPNSLEGTPGNLLEKTLSQYYPEHVSIAPQTSGPPPDTVDGQGTQSPSLTSGFPISAQMSTSEPQPDPGASANAQGSNGYNLSPYMVNGFSNSYGDHEQQQQQQQQQQSYPLHGHLGQDQPHSLGQVDQGPGRAPSTHLSTQQQQQQQHQNGTEGYPTDSQGMYGQPSQDFNQSSFLEQNTPVQAGEGNGFGPFSGPDTGQHQVQGSERSLQYRMQQQAQCPASLPAQPEGAPGPQQSRHENGMEDMACPATPQRGWIDLNSSQPQPRPASNPPDQTQQQKQMWRSFPPRSQPEQQAAAPQAQGQMMEPDPAQRFQNRGGFAEGGPVPKGFQQQQQQNYQPTPSPHSPAQHNTAPEWQQSNPKGPHMQQPHSQQQMPSHCSLPPQQQGDSRYRAPMQPEHLCETDPDLQEILSPAFLPSQQQTQQPQQKRPLSHPPQFDGQQRKSPGYRPHSQPQPGQPQQQPPPSSPSMRNNGPQPNNNNQNQHDPALFGFNSPMEMQQQQYASCPVGGTPKQYQAAQQPQPNHQRQQSDHRDFPMQAPPHLSQGAVGQMYVKAEPQEACAQYQRGPPGGHLGSQEDFQRHAALRTHLLQRQERHGPPHPPHSPGDFQPALRAVKMENGVRFEAHPQQQLQGREIGMGMGMDAGIQIKQEPGQSQCEQGSVAERSILATMEQTLRQYQLSPVFERKSLIINSPQRVKVESSGAVTILSTHTDLGAGREAMGPTAASGSLRRPPDFTPKKEPVLQSFMESPMKLLDTPIKNLLDTPIKTQYDIASCHCVEQISEKDEGPYYTHLGAAPNVPAIRETMEKRSGLTGKAIRIEKVIYTGKEGKSTQGCPIAKWVIRRSSPEEKLLVLVRERSGHTCETACIIVVILVWDGISTSLADRLYSELSDTLKKHGALTQRRCAINEERTCACQGLEAEACGASFSFGCSWSMYYNGCKFARSKIPRKFKLLGDDPKEEEKLEYNLQNLATLMGPTYKALAPDAYGNQVEHEHRAPDCRLGYKEGRPFSGVTACLDFCAHSHRDLHNMQGGSTVVCTLTREDNREIGKIPEDEQLHVLPLYKASKTDEFGSEEAQKEKIKSGAIQVLSTFRRQIRMLSEPAKSCRQKKLDAKKAAANKNAMLDTPNSKAEKALQAKLKNSTYESTLQSTPGTGLPPGAMGAMLQPGQHPNSLSAQHAQLQQLKQQQHQNSLSAYPGSPHPANYPRFPNHPGSFPSTSKPGSMYGPQPTASPYPSPLHVPNSYMNGSNPASPYPGYQCNGGMPLDNYHPYYASNPKHLDMYRQQRPALYPEQQYSAHQRYGVNYPPRYGEPALQVNGFGSCSIRPSVHPMGPYSPYGPAGAPDPQFLDALSIPSSAHPGLDYAAAASKSNQFGGYSNPYLSQSPQMFPSGQDPFRMQIKTEMGLAGVKGLPTQLAGECMTPGTQPMFGLLNGGLQGPMIKQEPDTPQTPTTPQKPEVWSDNEHNFLDPDIGGVAVAPSHGSILIECAKRELHATTPLKNPDRNHPTRISLVFYQHKNMNEAKHGLALWEAKMAEKAREKEEEAERNGGEGTPSKSSKKGAKREHPEPSEQTGEPPYKRFIQTLMERSLSCTTNTYVTTAPYAFTKVTGPYSRFV